MFSIIHSNFGMGYNFTYLVMPLEALPLDALNTNIDKPSLHEKYIPSKRQTLHSHGSAEMKKIDISQLCLLGNMHTPKVMVKEGSHLKGNKKSIEQQNRLVYELMFH